jgi:hypothetical protein
MAVLHQHCSNKFVSRRFVLVVQMASALEEWLDQIRRTDPRYPTLSALAEAVQISPSAFGRQIKGGSLGLEPLLRLALATGTPASVVLMKAGKGELAALIESCYGSPAPVPAAVREFQAMTEELPASVIRSALAQLAAFQAAWPGKSDADIVPPATPPTMTRKPSKRGARDK